MLVAAHAYAWVTAVSYLVHIAAHTHHARYTKIVWFQRETCLIHECDQEATETRVHMQRNAVL